MRILNFGSLNIDYVYEVDHILQPGETEASVQMRIYPGGKGLNQSIALVRAGQKVYHAGIVGKEDGDFLLQVCRDNDICTDFIQKAEGKSGHAIIQVDIKGQNSILLYGGGNQKITREYVDEVLAQFDEGDILILQNEVNLLDYIVEAAWNKKMLIALNPSHFDGKVLGCDLKKISLFMVNEIEGRLLAGIETHQQEDGNKIVEAILEKYPYARVVLTMGEQGAFYGYEQKRYYQKIFPVKAVDTTAAGDTFTGYFIAGFAEEKGITVVLEEAAKAAAIAVSRKGAAPSIPTMKEVMTGWKDENIR